MVFKVDPKAACGTPRIPKIFIPEVDLLVTKGMQIVFLLFPGME